MPMVNMYVCMCGYLFPFSLQNPVYTRRGLLLGKVGNHWIFRCYCISDVNRKKDEQIHLHWISSQGNMCLNTGFQVGNNFPYINENKNVLCWCFNVRYSIRRYLLGKARELFSSVRSFQLFVKGCCWNITSVQDRIPFSPDVCRAVARWQMLLRNSLSVTSAGMVIWYSL